MLFSLNADQIECCSDWVLIRLNVYSFWFLWTLGRWLLLCPFVSASACSVCSACSWAFFLSTCICTGYHIPSATARIPGVLLVAIWVCAPVRFVGDVQFWLPLCTIQARFRSAFHLLRWCISSLSSFELHASAFQQNTLARGLQHCCALSSQGLCTFALTPPIIFCCSVCCEPARRIF